MTVMPAANLNGADRYRLGEFHRFEAAGQPFFYLVSAGAVFALDEAASSLLDMLSIQEMTHRELVGGLRDAGHDAADAEELARELLFVRGIVPAEDARAAVPVSPPADFPLQALVLNLTNQCNLACKYCYEFGADRIADPAGKARYMTLETAQASVDFLLEKAAGRRAVHITFFGGETLMNFKLLRQVVGYAQDRGAAAGCKVGFSLTTNATLLSDEIIAFLSENEIGVTVSLDGPPELQDRNRVYKNGKGSYAVIEPRLRRLIAGHKTRAITARVTLTEGVNDVTGIFRHLKDDLGFHEVGFAPVTDSGGQDYSIDEGGMDGVLAQFRELADEWLAYAVRGEMHGFTNVSETIGELIQGTNKSHPCGAGLGLLGVDPSGSLSPCHRFVDSDEHALGDVHTGIDQDKREDFLNRGHVAAKYECGSCWARPLCAGGCHHEAFVRYGDTGHANLHYCDWIRSWTNTCLEIYGTVSVRNPEFLEKFSERKALV